MESIQKLQDFNVQGEHDTYFTPNVQLRAAAGTGSITGESYLENSFEFYDEIIRWLTTYFAEGGEQFMLDIKLSYFNTSSSRAILDLLRFLQAQKEKGKRITVNWFYPNPDDAEMKLEAEDFMEESGLELTLIEYQTEG